MCVSCQTEQPRKGQMLNFMDYIMLGIRILLHQCATRAHTPIERIQFALVKRKPLWVSDLHILSVAVY